MTTLEALQTNADIVHIEPDDDGITAIEVRISAWEAVARAMRLAASRNIQRRFHGKPIIFLTTEQALYEYILVHWAIIEPFSQTKEH